MYNHLKDMIFRGIFSMKLDINTLEGIVRGAVRVEENDGYVSFLRFTKEQAELYKTVCDDFYNKTYSCAGIVLDFVTDSETLGFKADLKIATSRSYYSFDIFVDGKPVCYIDNFSNVTVEKSYSAQKFEYGSVNAGVNLGKGEKRVTIYFPWSMAVRLCELTLDDGAKVLPCEKRKKMLIFGDSITHGYDAMRPSGHYANILCDALGYEQINKGIGAERYRPELAQLKEPYEPDVVTVVYGTNDWNSCTREEFVANCQGFLEALAKNYKNSKIIVLSPSGVRALTTTSPSVAFSTLKRCREKLFRRSKTRFWSAALILYRMSARCSAI